MTYENVSQRVVDSYRRQMIAFAPVVPEGLSPDEQRAMRVSQQALDAFYRAFYDCAYDHPEAFGLPLAADACVEEGDGKDEKQAVTRTIKSPRTKMAYGIDFLYLAGQRGTLVGRSLRLDSADSAAFFAKGPRTKRKFLAGMESVGLSVTEGEDATVIDNARYPNMMPALVALAKACARIPDDPRMSTFLFARCDLRVLQDGYRPGVLDTLRLVLSPAEYAHAVELHRALGEMGYEPALSVDGAFGWRVQYQGRRAVKGTPFFEFEYDERQRNQLDMRVKCASANRLVPLLAQQPERLQEDFFRHAAPCGACGWCKTRKGMQPSVLRYGGEKKTICWYMRRRFDHVDGEAVDLVVQYAHLHEALAA